MCATRRPGGRPPAFAAHRLALAPALPGASAATLERALAQGLREGGPAFAALLADSGLGPLWHRALHAHGLQQRLPAAALDALKAARTRAAAAYCLQTAALRQIDRLFEAGGIAYAAIKGAQVRELAYDEPALRPACDIDILVRAGQRAEAGRALAGAGFAYCPDPCNLSHEAGFARPGVSVDLHWDVLRPGRTPAGLAGALLDRRRRAGGFYGLDEADAMLLMLAHPAFAKHVCTPHMGLHRAADFAFWTARRAVDWDLVAARLDGAGLKTAAWTVLSWFGLLGLPTPAAFAARIRPGPARARYLRHWLEHDLPTRWQSRPLLVQLGLTALLHDRPRDAWRAFAGRARAGLSPRPDPFAGLDQPPPLQAQHPVGEGQAGRAVGD
jgi:hypothetical protein